MITLSVNKNRVTINIKYSAYTRNVDLHSSYTYTTYTSVFSGSSCFVTVMSDKYIKISSCACFLVISGVLFAFSYILRNYRSPLGYQGENKTITFSNRELQCDLHHIFDDPLKMKTPSLKSFIRVSTAQELRLRGLLILKTRQCVSTAS